jgi:hypothetical protein
MKTLLSVGLIACFVLSLFERTTEAGYKDSWDGVFIWEPSPNQFIVRGYVGAVRASAGDTAYIGCHSNFGNAVAPWGWCQAVDSSGTYKGCSWSGVEMAGVVAGIGPMSYLDFSIENNVCVSISIQNYSYGLPAVP